MDIKLTITVTGKPTFTLTQDSLYEQDLSVGYGASDFSFGLFTAGNFIFTVANENLQYSRDDFAGARIKLEYGSQVMGWYNVDRIKEQDDGYELEIQCYDDILKFDCPFTAGESDFPMSFERALSHCMYLAGLSAVDFDTTSLAVITRSEVVEISIQKSFLDVVDNYTCRDVIRAIAELSCCQATLDTDGRLLLNNPFRGSSFEQILSDRVALEYDRETKPISKVKMTIVPYDGTSETFEYGTDTGHTVDFTLPVFSGSLLRDDILSVVQSAHDQLNGRAVSALSATHEIMGDEIKLYRIGDRYLADDTSGEPLRKRLDGMITSIRYSGNFEFSYSCPGFSQEGNGTSANGNPSGSIVAKILAPVNEEIRRSNVQLTGLISNAKAELSDAIEILDGDFGVVSQQVGEMQSDIFGLQVNYADIFAEMYDTEQGMRARLYKAETEIAVQAGLITSKVGQTEYDEFVSDIFGVTESIEQDLSVVEQTAQSVSATVSSHTGQISGLDGRLTSAQAKIDVHADQISQTVTKTEFNNLQIGVNNLLVNSTLVQGNIGGGSNNMGENLYSSNYVRSDFISIMPSTRYQFKRHRESTVSPILEKVVYYTSEKVGISAPFFNRAVGSFSSPANAAYMRVVFRPLIISDPQSVQDVIDAKYKIEQGDKTTDWSPALEDIDNAIALVDGKFSNYYTKTQSDSQISQLSNEIALRVTTSTYNTGMATKANQTALNTTNDNLSSLTSRVDSAELKITDSAIVSTVRSSTDYTDDLNAKTGKNEIISTINQSAEAVSIDASKINLNGVVTANNNFKINLDGSMETIAGKIGAFNITSDVLESGNMSDMGFVIAMTENDWRTNHQRGLSIRNQTIYGTENYLNLTSILTPEGFECNWHRLTPLGGDAWRTIKYDSFGITKDDVNIVNTTNTYFNGEYYNLGFPDGFNVKGFTFGGGNNPADFAYLSAYDETYGYTHIQRGNGSTVAIGVGCPNPNTTSGGKLQIYKSNGKINRLISGTSTYATLPPMITGSYTGNGANGRAITITGLTQSSEVFIINASTYVVLGKKAVADNKLQVNAVSGENTSGITYRYVAFIV